MTPAERRARKLAVIEAAGAALVADWPPLTDEEIADLVVILAPAFPRAPVKAAAPQRLKTAA